MMTEQHREGFPPAHGNEHDISPHAAPADRPIDRAPLEPLVLRKEFSAIRPDDASFEKSREKGPLNRGELSLLSGLSRYRVETLELLASYFKRDITRRAADELASKLVFPHDKEVWKLFARSLEKEPAHDDLMRLLAHAISPDNERGAELTLTRLKGERPLEALEIIELYGIERFPHAKIKAAEVTQNLSKLIVPIQAGQVDVEGRKAALALFARGEAILEVEKPLDARNLRVLFRLKEGDVKEVLEHALSPEELRLRSERIDLAKVEERYALALLRRKAVRDLVAIENDLHKSKLLTCLSTAEEIGELFHFSGAELRKALRLLPREDLDYRNDFFKDKALHKKKEEMIAEVKGEIAALRKDATTPLATDAELAANMGVSPTAIFHCLREGLSQSDFEYRELTLRERGQLDASRSSLIAFVREELKAFDKGEISNPLSKNDLAVLFHASEKTIADKLSERSTGLSPAEERFRDYIFEQRAERSTAIEALRQVELDLIRQKLERILLTGLGSLPVAPPETSPREQRQFRVRCNGHGFDSAEEAACGLLLERYVPGFKLIDGDTLQRKGEKSRFDFVVNGVIVEYHPIKLFWNSSGEGSFKTREEYAAFLDVRDSLTGTAKKFYCIEMIGKLSLDYRAERERAREGTPDLKGKELVISTTPEAFFYAVIERFGKAVPPKEKFLREFGALTRRIKREQALQKSGGSRKAA